MSIEDDHTRKPRTGMWKYFLDLSKIDIDYENSIYCGDAAGR